MRKYARNVKFLMMLIEHLPYRFLFTKTSKFSYEYEKGRIWNQKDLVSPYNFAILKTPRKLITKRKPPMKALHQYTSLMP
jgi:hypothetical protein